MKQNIPISLSLPPHSKRQEHKSTSLPAFTSSLFFLHTHTLPHSPLASSLSLCTVTLRSSFSSSSDSRKALRSMARFSLASKSSKEVTVALKNEGNGLRWRQDSKVWVWSCLVNRKSFFFWDKSWEKGNYGRMKKEKRVQNMVLKLSRGKEYGKLKIGRYRLLQTCLVNL